MSKKDFYKLTPKEFEEVQIIWYDDYKDTLERQRLHAFYTTPHSYKKPSQMWKLPWDQNRRTRLNSESHIYKWDEKDWAKYDNINGAGGKKLSHNEAANLFEKYT